jgi:type I restriction enzyme, S subunit
MDRGFRHSECRDFSWDWRNVVMNGWKTSELGEIAVIIYGYTAKASGENIGPKFLRITDIQDEMVDWSSVPYCPINEDDFKRHKLIDQDIVFARTGATTGKSYLVSNPPKSVAASYLIRLRIKDSNISAEFVSKYFQTYEYWNSISSGISGSAQGGFNASKLSALVIPIPPLSEQKRIVAIVDEAFESIDIAINNTKQNLTNARELFESYLNTIFTSKDNGWVEKTLREVSSDFGRGKSKHRPRNDPKLYGGSYPFIQTGDVRNCNHVITKNSQFYSEDGLAQSKLWPRGTICITIAANIAETGILGFDACFPDSIIGIVVDYKITSNDFVEYLLQSVKARIKAKGQGSAQENINLATFENERFPFPDIYQQRAIVENLNQLATETQRLEVIYQEKLAALTELKQSILQKAFTGKLTADSTNQTTKKAKEVIAA